MSTRKESGAAVPTPGPMACPAPAAGGNPPRGQPGFGKPRGTRACAPGGGIHAPAVDREHHTAGQCQEGRCQDSGLQNRVQVASEF